MNPGIHRSLKEEAELLGESLNSLCIKKLLGEHSKYAKIPSQKIAHRFSPLAIALFGSTVRGEARDSSDIDLLIVLNSNQVVARNLYATWDEVFSQEDRLSPQFVHLPKSGAPLGSLWLEVALESEILYDPTETLQRTLREIRQKIAEGLYQRKTSHGHPYWISQEK